MVLVKMRGRMRRVCEGIQAVLAVVFVYIHALASGDGWYHRDHNYLQYIYINIIHF